MTIPCGLMWLFSVKKIELAGEKYQKRNLKDGFKYE